MSVLLGWTLFRLPRILVQNAMNTPLAQAKKKRCICLWQMMKVVMNAAVLLRCTCATLACRYTGMCAGLLLQGHGYVMMRMPCGPRDHPPQLVLETDHTRYIDNEHRASL